MSTPARNVLSAAGAVQHFLPPNYEGLLILFPTDDPKNISSAMATAVGSDETADGQKAALGRARMAAAVFLEKKPNIGSFAPQS